MRISRRQSGMALHSWKEFVSLSKKSDHILQRCIQQICHQNLVKSFRRWMQFKSEMKTYKMTVRSIIRRFKSRETKLYAQAFKIWYNFINTVNISSNASRLDLHLTGEGIWETITERKTTLMRKVLCRMQKRTLS